MRKPSLSRKGLCAISTFGSRSVLETRTVWLATGHKTRMVFDSYAEHALESDLARVTATTIEVFSSILPFKPNSA
jgi:hypothetical protein